MKFSRVATFAASVAMIQAAPLLGGSATTGGVTEGPLAMVAGLTGGTTTNGVLPGTSVVTGGSCNLPGTDVVGGGSTGGGVGETVENSLNLAGTTTEASLPGRKRTVNASTKGNGAQANVDLDNGFTSFGSGNGLNLNGGGSTRGTRTGLDFSGILGGKGGLGGIGGAGGNGDTDASLEAILGGSRGGFDVFADMFDILSEKACDFALNEASRSADFFVLVPAQSLEELFRAWYDRGEAGFREVTKVEMDRVKKQVEFFKDVKTKGNIGTFSGVQEGNSMTGNNYLRCQQLSSEPTDFIIVTPQFPRVQGKTGANYYKQLLVSSVPILAV